MFAQGRAMQEPCESFRVWKWSRSHSALSHRVTCLLAEIIDVQLLPSPLFPFLLLWLLGQVERPWLVWTQHTPSPEATKTDTGFSPSSGSIASAYIPAHSCFPHPPTTLHPFSFAYCLPFGLRAPSSLKDRSLLNWLPQLQRAKYFCKNVRCTYIINILVI